VENSGVDCLTATIGRKGGSLFMVHGFPTIGLIEQLEFEGFNNADATYAVGEIGL
jgi:hypothetical protein